jgi:cytochrome P450
MGHGRRGGGWLLAGCEGRWRALLRCGSCLAALGRLRSTATAVMAGLADTLEMSSDVALPLALLSIVSGVAYLVIFLRPYARDLDGNELPGPPARLLLGNYADIKKIKLKPDGTPADATSTNMMKLYEEYGKGGLVCFRVASLMVVGCHSRQAVKDVLTGNYAKFPKASMYKNLEYGLGKGLVTANGDSWRAHRRIVEKAFHLVALRGMLPKFAKHTSEMLDVWARRLGKEAAAAEESTGGSDATIAGERNLVTDVFVEMTHLTLDIICDTGFGYQMNSKSSGETASPVAGAISTLLFEINARFKAMTPLDKYFGGWARMRRARKAWHIVVR